MRGIVRITVIVADAAHAIHVGGEIERYTRTFDAPSEMAAFLEKVRSENSCVSVSLAIEDQQAGKGVQP